MIKKTDGDCFEEMRSLEQNLTFEKAGKEFSDRNIKFGQVQMKALGIMTQDGVYMNLGLLLSDQCVHTIKAVYASVNQGEAYPHGKLQIRLLLLMQFFMRWNRARCENAKSYAIDTMPCLWQQNP